MHQDHLLCATFAVVLSLFGVVVRDPVQHTAARAVAHTESAPVECRCVCEAPVEQQSKKTFFIFFLLFFLGVLVGGVFTWCCLRRSRRPVVKAAPPVFAPGKGHGRLLTNGLDGA